jgi:hypothetical protein
MNRLITTALTLGVLASSLLPSAQAATPVKLRVLYSSGKAAPGSDRPLAELSAPSVSGSNVVFLGRSTTIAKPNPDPDFPNTQINSTLNSVYALFNGKVRSIKQVESIEPIGGFRPAKRFGFSPPALLQSTVAFSTFEALLSQGINSTVERYKDGTLQTIVPICPTGFSSNFSYTTEQSVALSGDAVAWIGNAKGCPIVGNSPPDSTIWRSRQGNNEVLVDYKTKLADTTIRQYSLFRDITLKGDQVQFATSGSGGPASSLYRAQNGQASEIYDGEKTAIPNVALNPVGLCGSDFSGARRIFCLAGSGQGQGIYQQSGKAAIVPIVTVNTSVPGEQRKFAGLASPRVSGSNIFFVETLAGVTPSVGIFETIAYPVKAIYVKKNTKIVKVFAVGGAIGGKEAVGLSIGTNPISNNRVVFAVKFKDGSTSVVQADL